MSQYGKVKHHKEHLIIALVFTIASNLSYILNLKNEITLSITLVYFHLSNTVSFPQRRSPGSFVIY